MRLLGVSILAVAISMFPGIVRADDAADKKKAALNKEVARAHHETAKKHFRLSNFEEALVQFNSTRPTNMRRCRSCSLTLPRVTRGWTT